MAIEKRVFVFLHHLVWHCEDMQRPQQYVVLILVSEIGPGEPEQLPESYEYVLVTETRPGPELRQWVRRPKAHYFKGPKIFFFTYLLI
jgi:hypothetical protein